MTTLTRDRCPRCEAWLVLVEVAWVAPERQRYPGIGCMAVYECPNCSRVFETWAHDPAPLEAMSLRRRSLRKLIDLRRPN